MTLDTQRSEYGLILLVGIGLGLATTIPFNYFPELLGAKLAAITGGMDGKWILVGMLVLSAIFSLPISNVVFKVGMIKTFWISLAISLMSIALLFILTNTFSVVIITVIFTLAFTALSVSSLPLAISRSNYYEKVFCVGIFFSGVAIPNGIVEISKAIQ